MDYSDINIIDRLTLCRKAYEKNQSHPGVFKQGITKRQQNMALLPNDLYDLILLIVIFEHIFYF